MLRWIVVSGLRIRRLVLAAAVVLIVVGVVQLRDPAVDALPEFSRPTVEVQTEALGLSAAEVEQLITVPLEQDLLVGVAFLDEIESVSLPGLSSVVMTFEPGTDPLDARQVVQERLTQAAGVAGLPAVAKLPQMIQPVSTTSRVAMAKLSSNELTPIEMSVLARWVIGPRLLAVDGVANVSIWGNRERQLQVLVDPERLRRNGVVLSQVVRTAGNSLEVSPLSYLEASTPGTGGFIDTPNQRLNIFHEQAISTPGELAAVPLEGPDGERLVVDGRQVLLGDVTDVVENHQPLIGDTACSQGEQCLMVVVEQFPGANTRDVSAGIDKAFAALGPGLADMRIDSSVYRPAEYVDSAVSNVGRALIIGGILLILLLLLLTGWRRTVVSVVTMASSAAVALVVLDARGADVNLLVVSGLVLGLTAVVHDAVNDVEAVARWLRERRQAGARNEVATAVVDAVTAARRLVTYGVLITAAAVLPLFFLRNEGDAFLPPIALSYLLAVISSMVCALLVLPAMCVMLLTGKGAETGGRAGDQWLPSLFARVGSWTLGRPGAAIAVLAVMAVATLLLAPFVDSSLRPGLRERDVVVALKAEPGTSLPKMTAATAALVADLEELSGVDEANAHVGRAVLSDQSVDVNEAQIWVSMDRDADYDATLASVEETVAGHEELSPEVSTYTDDKVREVLGEGDSDLTVRVYGQDQDVLDTKVAELEAGMAELEGVSDVRIEPVPEELAIEVRVDLAKAQALGIKPGDVRRAAATLLGGITVGNLFEEQKVFDVVVWGAPQVRQDVNDIRNLLIDTPDGRQVRLDAVAEVVTQPDKAVIRHESVARYAEVGADVSGRDVSDVAADVEVLIARTEFPLDHHAEVLDGYAERQDDLQILAAVTLAAVLAVLLLLQAAFRSWRSAAIGLVALVASMSGGLLAVLVTEGELALGSAAGLFVGLGIAARGLVTLVGHYQRLRLWREEALDAALMAKATSEMVTPLVVSALGMVALLGPAAVLGRQPGLEVLQPAAVAILGVLATTTIVNLLVMPAMYLRFGKAREDDIWADDVVAADAPRPREETAGAQREIATGTPS
jgi:Cu/Ag efflux pump CusA